jgi:hypothetical protein
MITGGVRQALARIENAFSRVEAAAARPRGGIAATGPSTSTAASLVEQNMRLRETIDETLGQLDLLIERIEG